MILKHLISSPLGSCSPSPPGHWISNHCSHHPSNTLCISSFLYFCPSQSEPFSTHCWTVYVTVHSLWLIICARCRPFPFTSPSPPPLTILFNNLRITWWLQRVCTHHRSWLTCTNRHFLPGYNTVSSYNNKGWFLSIFLQLVAEHQRNVGEHKMSWWIAPWYVWTTCYMLARITFFCLRWVNMCMVMWSLYWTVLCLKAV